MTTYYTLSRVDGKGQRAAFTEESAANQIRDTFNERYESDYEVNEEQDAPASAIAKAGVIASLESTV